MKIENVPFTVTELAKVPPTEHKGESGMARWHTFEKGNIRVRIVEYSPGYLADHWCARGHVVLVLEGEVINELKDGTRTVLKAGMNYQTSDDDKNPHRSFTKTGAKLFIVD
jgi:quercetin dioxygenase-like cupin family protein